MLKKSLLFAVDRKHSLDNKTSGLFELTKKTNWFIICTA